jgi:hypothetical protein
MSLVTLVAAGANIAILKVLDLFQLVST